MRADSVEQAAVARDQLYVFGILKLMNQQNLMPDGVALNQPVLSSEVFYHQ